MMRPAGILGAIGIIALTSALLLLMLWIMGQPSLVHWWRAEYLMAGFIALLIGAVLLARRARGHRAETTAAWLSWPYLSGTVRGKGHADLTKWSEIMGEDHTARSGRLAFYGVSTAGKCSSFPGTRFYCIYSRPDTRRGENHGYQEEVSQKSFKAQGR